MKKRLSQTLWPALGIILFSLALFILHRELRHYTYHDLLIHFRALPAGIIYLASALTVLNFIVLTGYDTLAVHYIRHPLPYAKSAFTSFVGYAMSQGLGFAILTGGSIRFRLYSGWGLSAIEIANIIGFNGLTFWMGYLTLAGIAFLIEPFSIPALIQLPFSSLRPLGVLMLLAVFGYFLIGVLRRKPFRLWKWEFPVPSTKYFFVQISIASLDWAIAASVLYVLLPHPAGFTYIGFLGIFLVAQIAGISSHIPGGLGVFETIVILLLSPRISSGDLIGSLLAYRLIYYLSPLAVASTLLAGYELAQNRKSFAWLAQLFGKWLPSLVPYAMSYLIFVAGAILLFSGATPSEFERIKWLQDFMPLPVIELSHFLGSLSGMCLLLLARSIQRRLDAAYFLTALLLVAGVVFSLLKGFDYEEALILTAMLAALLPCRRFFYRRASLLGPSLTPGWITAIILVFLCTIWLGLFSFKHVAYSHDLWWRFAFTEDAPRFLRATVGMIGIALFFAFAGLLKPAAREPALPSAADLEKAGLVMEKSSRTVSRLALLGDKELLFSDSGNAFIMYGIEGRSWVSLGDPVGPEAEWTELAWRFHEMADRHYGWTIFYEVDQSHARIYLDLGLTLLKIGEGARVELGSFGLKGDEKKHLRHSHNRAQKDGAQFEVVTAEAVPALLPELKEVSEAWLADKRTREKGFSLGFFQEDYLKYFPLALVRKEGRVKAFANIIAGAGKEEITIDLMRYSPDAPEDVMDFLFIELMLWAQSRGYKWFNLGMAPLSGLEEYPDSRVWGRVGNLVFRHGENFYNFQGLRQYKQKFFPVWESKYIASPGGLSLPAILADLTVLTSRGIKGIVSK